jgi:hypothetical protein
VAEEHDEAWEIAHDIYVERMNTSRGAAEIRAYRDRACSSLIETVRSSLRGWPDAGCDEEIGRLVEGIRDRTVAETKARAEAAEAKVKTLASLINSEVVASMSTPDGLKPINSTGMRYAVDKWGSAEAKVKALEAKLAATEDWDARYRAAISCMKRVLSSQFGITGLAQASPAYPYADAIEAGIERLRQELRRKEGVLDKFREAARGL